MGASSSHISGTDATLFQMWSICLREDDAVCFSCIRMAENRHLAGSNGFVSTLLRLGLALHKYLSLVIQFNE